MSYRNLKAGDRVTIRTPQGQERTGKVQALLIFSEHVVLNMGGPHGTPVVCNDYNFVSVKRKHERFCERGHYDCKTPFTCSLPAADRS